MGTTWNLTTIRIVVKYILIRLIIPATVQWRHFIISSLFVMPSIPEKIEHQIIVETWK